MSTEDQNPTPEPDEAQEAAQDPQEDPDTFPRAYVQELRQEAAENRTKAKESTEQAQTLRDALQAAAVREATAGILHDPDTLPWSDEFNDDATGLPDLDKIRAAAETLAADKPWLSRPRGDAGQGFRGEDSDAVDLAGMLRAGA